MAFGRGGLVPSQILFSKDAVAHNCRHLPSSKRTDATANCVLIIDTASTIRCLTLHRSTAKWCYTPLPTLISQARSTMSYFPLRNIRAERLALNRIPDAKSPKKISTQSQHLHYSCPSTTISHRPSFLWYDMLGLDVFAVLIKADHVDMVVDPMLKFASSKVSTVSVSATLIRHSPHNGFCCVRGQHLIAILDNTDYPGFSCVDICLGSFKRLCLGRCFEYKLLGGLLNCG